MIDWTKSMRQTFEFYIVDPFTWKDISKIDNVKSATITRDESNETLGSATFEIEDRELGECYIRTYLVVNQNGVEDKIPLGTHLVQTPSIKFDGKSKSISLDAYSPLIELKECPPPIGYSILKDQPILSIASNLARENMRAPVIGAKNTDKLYMDFVSNLNDTWLTFIRDLVGNAKHKISMDELGRLIFEPKQDISSLQPVWFFNDDNSSILLPSLTNSRDLYKIPNVVEVIHSSSSEILYSRIENNDPNSPISIVNRGREVIYRDSNPSLQGKPTQEYLDNYATQLLRDLSCLEHKITYSHGYCPARIGDCVMLNYERAGLKNTKAKITSQNIKCDTGCIVEETAIYTTKLWR